MQNVHSIRLIEDVKIPERRSRMLNPAHVRELMASIEEVGLLSPIAVLPDGTLVSGLHRHSACELLGWKEIPVIIVELDAVHAEMAELDENLCHDGGTALERAEWLARRKELYEAIHPEAKHGGDRKSEATKIQNPDLDSPSFVDDTAKATGRSRSTIAEEVKLARDLDPEAKEKLRGTDVADNKSALKALASQPAEKQRELAAQGPEAVKAAVKESKLPKLPSSKTSKPPKSSASYSILLVMPTVRADEVTRALANLGFVSKPGGDEYDLAMHLK